MFSLLTKEQKDKRFNNKSENGMLLPLLLFNY